MHDLWTVLCVWIIRYLYEKSWTQYIRKMLCIVETTWQLPLDKIKWCFWCMKFLNYVLTNLKYIYNPPHLRGSRRVGKSGKDWNVKRSFSQSGMVRNSAPLAGEMMKSDIFTAWKINFYILQNLIIVGTVENIWTNYTIMMTCVS